MIRLSLPLACGIFLLLLPAAAEAAGPQLSASRLDQLDKHGYFTPRFKGAVHALINAQPEAVQADAEGKKLRI